MVVVAVIVYLSIQLTINLSIYLSIYLFVCLSACLPVCLSACLPACLSVCLPASLKTQQFCETSSIFELDTWKTKQFGETSSIFELDNIKNEQFWARLPKFLKLTTSKTKQFCEPSFKNGKLGAELMASYQWVLRFLHSTCLKYCACHEKVMPGHTKCCTCHAKSLQQTWRSDAPKCNPSQEISARTS